MAKTEHKNHLAGSSSPYLRQHADNPVNWYPWGEEAFALARAQDKPIFLSIGYSTCHWCHVMAHESFEDEGIAALLNAGFIAIKLDREEHPDIDESYMIATQIVAGQGGWPNSLFLLPDGEPFFAGTYFPKPAFASLLDQVTTQWKANRSGIEADAHKLTAMITQVQTRREAAARMDDAALSKAADQIMLSADKAHGGFGSAPKFAQESSLLFLLGQAARTKDAAIKTHILHTLDIMIKSGTYDQIGGGFHRYAVDREWRVPHFEKMLYNQSQMAQVLLHAWQISGHERYVRTLRETLDYVLEDLTDKDGGFYAARDADSEGVEGTFYVWTPAQIKATLPAADASFALTTLGITPGGNFDGGASVPFLPNAPQDRPAQERLSRVRQLLHTARQKRPAPHRDEKIITSWNGHMVQVMAAAALALDAPRYAQGATRAGTYLWQHLRGRDGLIYRTAFNGRAHIHGTQKDYAASALAFVALYDLSADPKWLKRAKSVAAKMEALFYDKAAGDFYLSETAGLFGRAKSTSDSQNPSGNALALELYARLSRRDADPHYRQMADGLAAALAGPASASPAGSARALYALQLFSHGETGAVRYLAAGRVRAQIHQSEETLELRLHMAPGWHINAQKPNEDYLIATDFTVHDAHNNQVAMTHYPKAIEKRLGFSKTPLALYEGTITLSAPRTAGAIGAQLSLQACDDKKCLAPETIEITLPPDTARS